jgi:type IV pilus assembly protein PilB
MGIEPFLISSSVVGVLAQRLIRKLCQNCAESSEAKDSDLNIGDINREFLEKRYNKNRFVLKKIKGCGECRYTGYKGRAAIYELMVVSDEIRALINSNEDANNIRKMAVKQGMQSLRDSALNKLVEGLTSIDEVLRLTQTDT